MFSICARLICILPRIALMMLLLLRLDDESSNRLVSILVSSFSLSSLSLFSSNMRGSIHADVSDAQKSVLVVLVGEPLLTLLLGLVSIAKGSNVLA